MAKSAMRRFGYGRGRSLSRKASEAFGKRGSFDVKTGRRSGQAGLGVGTSGATRAYPEQPDTWRGSEPEWAIYWAHTALGLRENEDFAYVPRLAVATGNIKGLQVDFFEYDINVAIDVQGLYWHYGISAAKQQDDLEIRLRVEATGATYIAIDEDDAMRDPIYYLREARNFRDHSRAGRGVV